MSSAPSNGRRREKERCCMPAPVFHGIPFPKTHDIHVLRALLPAPFRPKLDATTQELLTDYATVKRYPDAKPDIPLREARHAVAVARRVRREVRRHLPRAALRRKKIY